MKPTFLDYQQAREWLEQKAKEHGGLKRFTSTPEYKEVYQEIDALYRKETKDASSKALAKAGLEYGDEVEYAQLNLLMGGVIVVRGTLFERGLKPYVRLNPPVMGRREVRWHAGFKKSRGATASEDDLRWKA